MLLEQNPIIEVSEYSESNFQNSFSQAPNNNHYDTKSLNVRKSQKGVTDSGNSSCQYLDDDD